MNQLPHDPDLDLGHGVVAIWTSHSGHDRVGLIEYHPCQGGNCVDADGQPGLCGGGVLFDLPRVREAFPNREVWQVVSFDPLTIEPSVQCGCRGCTHHGYIRDGRWLPV